MKRVTDFFREDRGATATEYAVMLAQVLVVIVGSVTVFGQSLSGSLTGSDAAMFAGG